jgi:pimeloyl-ACP methyl ester carboxylesterase
MEHRTISTNGIKLHAVTAGDAAAPLVILLHGFPEFWYAWREYLPIFADAGYLAVAPDQRGFNLSDKPGPTSAYDLEELSADVLGIADAFGRERAVLVGHDWGAIVAWWTAMRHPERVSRLAVINVPHPLVMRRFMLEHPSQVAKSWYVWFFQIPLLPELSFMRRDGQHVLDRMVRSARPGTFSREDEEAYRAAWRQPGAVHSMLNWYRAAVRKLLPPAGGDPAVLPETLIVWGKQDDLLDARMADESARACASARVEYFDAATHWVHHEERDAVARLLLEHVKRA